MDRPKSAIETASTLPKYMTQTEDEVMREQLGRARHLHSIDHLREEAERARQSFSADNQLTRMIETFNAHRMPTGPSAVQVLQQIAEAGMASEIYSFLQEEMRAFESTLDDKQEVALRLVSFGQAVVFHVESVGYKNPCLIEFRGHRDDGSPVQLIQHISQLSFMLQAVDVRPGETKRPIGFRTPDQAVASSSDTLPDGEQTTEDKA